MNLRVVALAIFAIAVMVVGLIEWSKGWPVWKDPVKNPGGPEFPQWVPSVASPVFNLALGQLLAPLVLPGNLSSLWGIVLGLMGLAVTELCYKIIVQSIPQVVQSVIAKAVDVPPQRPPVSSGPIAGASG